MSKTKKKGNEKKVISKLPPKGLTISIIFDAMSLNYGENVSNISELKKFTKSGEIYSYISRQALRYDIFKLLVEYFSILETPLKKDKNKDTIQFDPDAKIDQYPEIDLFGYMKTEKGDSAKTRSAVIRITPAIALEPMNLSDVEFGNNLNFSQRIKENPNIFQLEHQSTLYTYTITIELDRVGEDDNDNVSLSAQEKAKRIKMVLDVLKVLNRNIKGRMENLNPLFVIGGVYNIKNPFFLGRLKIGFNQGTRKYFVETSIIKSVLEMSFLDEKIKNNTHIGFVEGYWGNEFCFIKLLPDNNVHNINDFFEELKKKVNDYYGVK